jgi:hypothetical protein
VADNRLQQLMQDALDASLSEEAQHEFNRLLHADPSAAEEYDQQQMVEDLLNRAPHERAPQRLAVTIMARLAETMKAEVRAREHSELSEAAVQVAVQLVTVATLPLLVGASYMLLNSMSDPELAETMLAQVAALLVLVVDIMTVTLDRAIEVAETDPETAMALLALLPVTLLTLVRYILDPDGEDDDEDA